MTIMSSAMQAEFTTAEAPSSVWLARPVHVDAFSEKAGSLQGKLSSGRAFLKVVAYPWGLEFDVCDSEAEL